MRPFLRSGEVEESAKQAKEAARQAVQAISLGSVAGCFCGAHLSRSQRPQTMPSHFPNMLVVWPQICANVRGR